MVFRHVVCSVAVPNGIARAGLNGNYSANHGDSEYHNNGSIQHSACIPILCSRSDWTLDLSVLRVSRQLYEETNHILWTTNAFFFSDSRSLPAFMTTLNPAQKRKLTHVQISVIVVQDNISKCFEPSSWSLGVNGSYINLLRDIKKLDLFIHFELKPSSKRTQDMIPCSPLQQPRCIRRPTGSPSQSCNRHHKRLHRRPPPTILAFQTLGPRREAQPRPSLPR